MPKIPSTKAVTKLTKIRPPKGNNEVAPPSKKSNKNGL